MKHLSRPSSPIILVFWSLTLVLNYKGTPSPGVLNTWGWGKFVIFDWNRSVYPQNGMRWAHGCQRMLIGNHRWQIDPCRFWMTLSDLERRDERNEIFQADLLNNTGTIWHRMKQFGMVNTCGGRGVATPSPLPSKKKLVRWGTDGRLPLSGDFRSLIVV